MDLFPHQAELDPRRCYPNHMHSVDAFVGLGECRWLLKLCERKIADVAEFSPFRTRNVEISDVGRCVDLFAPGTAIRSTWFESDTSSAVLSGTSMATPHVAGVAALYLQKVPRATPVQVAARLLFVSTKGVVKDAGGGSPNRLLYISAGV